MALHRHNGVIEWVGERFAMHEQRTDVSGSSFAYEGVSLLYQPINIGSGYQIEGTPFAADVSLNKLDRVVGFTRSADSATDSLVAIWQNGQIHYLDLNAPTHFNIQSRISGGSLGLPPVLALNNSSNIGLFAHEQAGTWVTSDPEIWDPATRSIRNRYSDIALLNKNLESPFFRNGLYRNLTDHLPLGWSTFTPSDINNHGVILGFAKRTIDAAGQPIPPANQITEPVLLVPYYLAQAEGDEAGRALVSGAPVYEPNDGIGKGVPIYHDPEHNISLSFGGPLSSVAADTATCVLWGSAVMLTETTPTSLVFQNGDGTVVVTLAEEPVLDSGVLERLSVVVTAPAYDLLAATYPLAETDAGTNVFQDVLVSASVRYENLAASTIDTLDLSVTDEMHSIHRTLTETAPDSGIFADEFYSVRLSGTGGGSFVPGASGLSAFITAAPVGLDNTRVNLGQVGTTSGGHYRNMEPATPTNLPASTLPDHAKWKLKIGIPPALAQSLGLALKTTEAQESVTFSATPDANGFYESVASFVMVPDHVTDTLLDGAVALKVKADQIDWSAATGDLKLFLGAVGNGIVAANEKVQPSAIVLEYLDRKTKTGQLVDTENKIRKAIEALGYTTTADYNAKKSKFPDYKLPERKIWYSMSHGGTENGFPNTEFNGLKFADASIRASDIEPLNLKYALVMVDGCASAQTSTLEEQDAREVDTPLLPNCLQFAKAFGPKAAYLGWAWSVNPGAAQKYSSEFLTHLSGKRTPKQAFDKLRSFYRETKHVARHYKLYAPVHERIEN